MYVEYFINTCLKFIVHKYAPYNESQSFLSVSSPNLSSNGQLVG